MTFLNRKKTFLEKLDKSKKGQIDKDILFLVNKINQNPNYFTTSSCSGRIVLRAGENKKQAKWLFVSHEMVGFNQIKTILKNIPKKTVWFSLEPVILHICSQTIAHAQSLLNKARPLFKKSNILTTKNKIIVEIRGSQFLETPIAQNNKLLITDNYLEFLIKQANKKLNKTKKKIRLFYKIL